MNKIINKNLVTLVFLLASIAASAQFVPGSATETILSSNSGSRATGNDIFDNGVGIYAVSVWDNGGTGTAGLGYDVAGFGTGFSAFAFSDAVDPDVCLVTNPQNGDVYAIAVYYSPSQVSWICDEFKFVSNAFVHILYQTITGGYYGYSINIDGNFNGDFAIIYDDISNNLWGVAGTVNFGFYLPVSPFQLTATNIQAPDIAIADNGVYNTLYITYVDLSSGDIMVESVDYSDFNSGSYFYTFEHQESNGSGAFFIPRIACPNNGSYHEDWAVVAEYRSGGAYYIALIWSYLTFITSDIYNDGNLTPFLDISAAQNVGPAICYDKYSNLWIGWSYDNPGTNGATATAFYPIALQVDASTGTPISSGYLEVPTALSTIDIIDLLSLSGRFTFNADLVYLTYHNVNMADIITKKVASSSSTLKLTNGNFTLLNSAVLESLNEVGCNYEVYDMQGRIVLKKRYDENVNDQFKKMAAYLKPAVYIVKVLNKKGILISTRKLAII